jgi:thiol-disulfide isomerase/thioredoxin
MRAVANTSFRRARVVNRMSKFWSCAMALIIVGGAGLTATTVQAQDALDLSAYRGKIVWVDFWASWCTPCRRSFPWLNDVMERYGKQDFVVVGVNLDKERALAEEFLRETPARFPIAYDPQGKSASAYDVVGMPSSFLIDREGKVISSHIGFRRDEQENYEAAIVQALSK